MMAEWPYYFKKLIFKNNLAAGYETATVEAHLRLDLVPSRSGRELPAQPSGPMAIANIF